MATLGNTNAEPDEILTAEEAAAFLKVPLRYIYERTMKRAIPHFKLGRKVRFSRRELRDWAESHRVEMESAKSEAEAEAEAEPVAQLIET